MPTIDIDELVRILPKLIRENDTVKGAIITALSGVVATRDDIKDLIREMDKRFEAVDKRFEAIQEQMDKRFEAMQEQMDKRFEAMQEQMDKRFERVEQKIEGLGVSIARIENKEGPLLEKTILKLLLEALRMENIDPESVRKEYIRDDEGRIFWKGYTTDIDVLIQNGNVYVLEIKASANTGEVAHFVQNARLYELVSGKEISRRILVALRVTEEVLASAMSYGVHVIYGTVI